MTGTNTEAVAKGFDVAALAPATDHIELEIFNPVTKSPTGIFISVYSKDSDAYKKVQRQQMNRRFKQMNRRLSVSLTAEENEAESLELLVACTKGWRNMVYKGEELEFDPQNVRMVYETIPVIREQVDDAINDRSGFMKR